MGYDDIFDYVVDSMDGFPEMDYRFTTMHDYIEEISEFLETTYAQKIQRLKARINSEKDACEKGELEGELAQLEKQGLEYLSHTIWGGVLVSIFATYESSIIELFSFFEKKHEKPPFNINKKGRISFIDYAQNYSKKNFNRNIYGSAEDRLLLKDLSQLRNSYVHNGCKIDALSKRLANIVVERKYKEFSLNTKEGKWVANSKNARLYFQYIYRSFIGYRRGLIDVMLEDNA